MIEFHLGGPRCKEPRLSQPTLQLYTEKTTSTESTYYFTSSKSRVLINIYRLSVIHPYRNHLIWLTCAAVMASRAVRQPPCPSPCMKTRLDGMTCPWLPMPPRTSNGVKRRSNTPAYFLTTPTVVKVYRLTVRSAPEPCCVSEEMNARAP